MLQVRANTLRLRLLLFGFLCAVTMAFAYPRDNDCINCNTNGCENPPSGYLIGHYDSDVGSGQAYPNGVYHSGCVYYTSHPDSGYSTCDPHTTGCGDVREEEETALSFAEVIDAENADGVIALLVHSPTFAYNPQRQAIQSVSNCDSTVVVRHLPVGIRLADKLVEIDLKSP